MDDQQLLDELLNRQESNELDFKSEPYNLSNVNGCSKFIKDIVAMANTPRSDSAYILIGVLEQSGKVVSILGVTQHPDESELGRIVSGKVEPTPRFTYRQVPYGNLEMGLIEIPCDQPEVVLPRTDYGVLRRNAVYIRRNTQNIEADGADLARIFRSAQDDTIPEAVSHSGDWEQLYRACDGFDPRRIYIAVLDRDTGTDARDWGAMSSVHWNMVVDFDTGTDTDGNYTIAKSPFAERHALHLSALEDSTKITARSTVWVAAAGLASRPTTNPSENWRDWNRSKAPQLERTMNELARITEPAPVTLVVFGGEYRHISTTCEILDRVFTDRIDYVFASPKLEPYEDIVENLQASHVAISLPDVCEGLREIQEGVEPTEEILFPQLGGGTVAISPDRARWMEEQLELVHRDIGLVTNDQSEDDSFLKGATVSWNDLDSRVDIDRDITTKLEQQVLKELDDRATRRVNLWHWPGAGATTVARRISWNLHREFPTVVAREIQPQETAERLQHLFGITRMPVLVIIDLPHVPKEVVDRLYDALRSSHIPAVLLTVEVRFYNRGGSGPHYLDAMLTTREAVRLSEVLATRVPDRRSELESLIGERDRRRRSPFYFGLTAYGRDFQGIESYVETRLSQASEVVEVVRDAVVLMAFAYYYGQVPLSLQTFGPIFNLPASKLISLTRVIPDYMRELLVEDNGAVRPAHHIIAEEILQQELGRISGGRHNWRIGLADLAIRFIDLLSDLPHRGRGTVSDVLRAVLIDRGRSQSPAGPWEADFSLFLDDVRSDEGRQRVLECLTESFPQEPHFWAHLGRFYSRRMRDHSRAHDAHQKAIGLMSDDSLLHHMAGMAWRADLDDLLQSIDDGFPGNEEAQLFVKIGEATKEFEAARALDRRSEYNYISQVQMILRVVGTVSSVHGYRYEPIQFLTKPGNDSYLELVDQAQNLLSDLTLIKGDETPSQLQMELQAGLDGIYGNQSQAIQRLTNVLDRREAHKPPLRRAIIRAYIARSQGDWSRFSDRELTWILKLAKDNITEEPASDYNLRLWLRAVRTENALSVDRVAEQLAYKRLQNPSVDTTYYLYIMKFLQLESGDLAAKSQASSLIEECTREAQGLSRTTSSFEWLGNDPGLGGLVHVSTLGAWDPEKGFWTKVDQLKRVGGRIASIRNQGAGEIELRSGLRVFFAPARGAIPGGYIAGQDVGREVGFYLGFSYDGLRAWSVGDPD